jgi:hypothetical protein
MRQVGLLLLGTVLLAACGTTVRPQADQDRDGRSLADAIRSAAIQGSSFKLDQQLLLTGGDIPSGQAVQIHAVVDDGVLKENTARFTYRFEQGRQTATFDMLVAQEQLFAKQHGASAWKATPVAAATSLFPSLRLDLVRETVLLASSVSSGAVTHTDAGFAHKYTIKPAPDQLEQLESVPVGGAAEDQFLKTAKAEVDVFLLLPSNRLGRIEVHLSGTDPSGGTKQRIDSAIDLRQAKVGAIEAPADAQAVTPANILT